MSEIVVRLFEKRGVPEVAAIYAEKEGYSNTLQLPVQSIEHWERKLARDGLTSLVAVKNGEVVGHLDLEVKQAFRRRHVAALGMGVKASARGGGVGTALLEAAIELCEKWVNISRIELEVFTDNAAAIALYQKCGF